MEKLVIAMCGLPASGKSTVAQRLQEGFAGMGAEARIFNNGDLRRSRLGAESAMPEFYHPDNREGKLRREQIAVINARSAKVFLREGGDVAILDATNAGRERRAMLEEMFEEFPLLFVECRNDDPDILEAAVARKAALPEFAELSPEEARAAFLRRLDYYRSILEPLGPEPCYMRVDSVRNRVLEERLERKIPHAVLIRDILVSDWVRGLCLARHGESEYNVQGRIGGDSGLTDLGRAQAAALASSFQSQEVPYVFISERRRARQTAAPLVAEHPEAALISLKEFDEIDAGIFDGMTYEEIRRTRPEEYAARGRDKYNYCYPQGEGYATMRDRVERGLRKALFLAGGRPGTLIVGHQAVNRMILSLFLFRRTEDVPYIYVPQNRWFHIVATHRKKLIEPVACEPVTEVL